MIRFSNAAIILSILITGMVSASVNLFATNPVTNRLERVWVDSVIEKPGDGTAAKTAVYWQEETGGGVWSEPEQVSLVRGHDASNPGFAIDQNGNRYVIYESHGPFTRIILRSKSVDEKPDKWSPPVYLNQDNYSYTNPEVAAWNKLSVSYYGDGNVFLAVTQPDDYDPWEKLKIRTTVENPEIRLEEGTAMEGDHHTWITFIYDGHTIKWLKLDDGIDGPYDELVLDGNWDAARARIKHEVLNGM